MVNIILTSALGIAITAIYLRVSKWRRNYQTAVATGLPVFYSPVYLTDAWWMMLSPLLLPLLKLLPRPWKNPWLQMAQVWGLWKTGHQPFEDAGRDTFILATPKGNMLWTCDNAVIYQLFTQHPKVEQPVEIVKFYNLWGPTISSVQGDEWKAHRRAVSAGFGTAINKIAWEEAQHQTEMLVNYWIEKENSTISVIRHWTSQLALHVLSSGVFNKRLEWSNRGTAKAVPTGHQWSFEKALPTMLEHLATIFVTPRALLGRLPGKKFQEANIGFTEMTKYLQELQVGATDNMKELANKRSKTLLEAVVISAADPVITGKKPLPQESVTGNIFFTLLAGHETTGATLGFLLLLLAIYPEYQRKVQIELDDQLGTRPKSEWTVEKDFQALQKGYIGAIQKETLKLYNPGSFFMRKTVESVTLTDSQGCSYRVPRDTLTLINNGAAARNPAVWQKPYVSPERRAALSDSPALYFNPDRWLGVSDRPEENQGEGRAPAWLSFGAGGRACPGKAFAQIEMTSIMATLFKDYSLELIVDDATLQKNKRDMKLAWEETRDKATKMLYDDIRANISIGLYKELPLRIVRRNS